MSQRWLAAVLLIALSSAAVMAGGVPAALAAGPATRGYATPDDATGALVAAMRANNTAALRNVLGPGSEPLIQSGDTSRTRRRGSGSLRRITPNMRSRLDHLAAWCSRSATMTGRCPFRL